MGRISSRRCSCASRSVWRCGRRSTCDISGSARFYGRRTPLGRRKSLLRRATRTLCLRCHSAWRCVYRRRCQGRRRAVVAGLSSHCCSLVRTCSVEMSRARRRRMSPSPYLQRKRKPTGCYLRYGGRQSSIWQMSSAWTARVTSARRWRRGPPWRRSARSTIRRRGCCIDVCCTRDGARYRALSVCACLETCRRARCVAPLNRNVSRIQCTQSLPQWRGR